MADDFPAELTRAYARIEELESYVGDLEQDNRRLRTKNWWRTYNAALTGHNAYSGTGALSLEEAHKSSAKSAELAHGPLPAKLSK